MRIFICVDDTDDLTKSTSTGKIADLIAKGVCSLGGEMLQGITRHQLLIHEDIDYTSHNSSMCIELEINPTADMEEIKKTAERILRENMADTSDPGICFCTIAELDKPESLIAFGKRAQREVIKKQEAYDLAEANEGVELYEYGGTGCGVIGAIAGVGLRLSGSDGMLRGKVKSEENTEHTAAEWKQLISVEQFIDFETGGLISDNQVVISTDQIKRTMVDHKVSVVAKKTEEDKYRMCKKKEIFEGDRRITSWTSACDKFCRDNDIEECYTDNEEACYNCLYRRWTAEGYICVANNLVK